MSYKIKKLSLIVLLGYFFFLAYPQTGFTDQSDDELFLVAQKAFDDGFYDVAMRYTKQLLETYPETKRRTQANLLLGQCYFFQRQYLEAYNTFSPLLQQPEFKDATLYWLGETHLKGSDYIEAEKNFQQLISVYPNSIYTPQGMYSLGWTYYEQDKFTEAQKAFTDLLQKFPNHQLAEDAAFKLGETQYHLHDYKNTIAYFKNFIQQYPQSTRQAEANFYIGESYYYLEDYLNALTFYAQSENLTSDNKLALMSKVSLGWSYLKLGKFELSQKHFDEALAFSKEKGILSDDVFLGQANLYSEMQDYPKAIEAYTQLIENFPNTNRIADAYLGRANSFYLNKNYAKAILDYQTVIDKFSTQPNKEDMIEKAYFGMAWAYLKSGSIDASVKIFETVKDKSDNKTVKVSALTQIGDAYQDSEQYEKAMTIYDRVLTEYPDSPYTDYVQYREGVALLKMEKIDEAMLSLQSLQTNFPKSKYIHDTYYYLAVASFKKEDWLNTIDHIQKYIKDSTDADEFLAEAYYILGLSHFNLNDYPNALKAFQKVIKDFPNQTIMVKNAQIAIAKSRYKSGETSEALKQFNLIINKYPDSEIAQEALLFLGDHHLQASEFDTAISYYQQFIEKFPGSNKLETAYYELGQAFQAKGELDKAVEMYSKVDIFSDKQLYAKSKLAIADIFSQQDNKEASIENYQKIVNTSPEYQRDAYMKIAELYKKSSDFTSTLEFYKKAAKADKGSSQINNAEIQFSIGDAYELLKNNDSAVEEYLKIPYLYPNEKTWVVKAYLRTARIFEDEEKWDKARLIYYKVIELKPEELKFAQERLEWIEKNVPQ